MFAIFMLFKIELENFYNGFYRGNSLYKRVLNKDYSIFWQNIHRIAKNKRILLRVMFELTYRCNFYCRHCYVPLNYRSYGELKTKEV
ncbi:MAG: hypothetical protein NC820_06200, partial [Candidatus Omnitrophica bacterium]|nr:hypothetical protein [Candidatus Omnitrophota bacterium]